MHIINTDALLLHYLWTPVSNALVLTTDLQSVITSWSVGHLSTSKG